MHVMQMAVPNRQNIEALHIRNRHFSILLIKFPFETELAYRLAILLEPVGTKIYLLNQHL